MEDEFGFLSLHCNFLRTPTKDIIVPKNTCDLPTEYAEELRVSDPKLRTFASLGSNAFLFFVFEFPARRCRHYKTNQPNHGHIAPILFYRLKYRFY